MVDKQRQSKDFAFTNPKERANTTILERDLSHSLFGELHEEEMFTEEKDNKKEKEQEAKKAKEEKEEEGEGDEGEAKGEEGEGGGEGEGEKGKFH